MFRPSHRSSRLAWLAAVALAGGCGRAPREASPPEPITTPAVVPAPRPQPVAWQDDRVEAAAAEARARGALLLVDAWAPWCHSCLSMKREVLSSADLGAYADRVVFAAIDTDKPSSAAFMGRYAIEVWPTFFVIDPTRDRVLAVHGGSASLPELKGVLDGALALQRSGGGGAFETALQEGAAAYAERRYADAAAAYARASEIAHPRASEAYVGAVRALAKSGDVEACVGFARRFVGAVSGSAMATDTCYYARECAMKLPPGGARDELLALVRLKLRAITSDPPPGATVDDRADALANLAEIERDLGDVVAERVAIGARIALLDGAAAAATTPEQAAVFDYMRMRAYEDAGKPELAVAMLEQRTKEMPDSYEPVARLASVLAKSDPKRAIDVWARAIALSYGPRRVRYLVQKAAVHEKLGDEAGVVATWKEVVAALEALPPGQSDAARLDEARRSLSDAEARVRDVATGPKPAPARSRPAPAARK